MKFLPKIKKLNSHGIAHFVLPLLVVVAVGAIGTYMVVGSHAAAPRKHGITLSGTSGGGSTALVDAHHGGLVLFTEGGHYSQAAVSVAGGANPKNYSCGGSFGTSNNRFLNLPSKFVPADTTTWAKTFSCTPIGNANFYHVIFEYKDSNGTLQAQTPAVNVDIDADICTYVHATGFNYKAPPTNGACPGKTTDAPTPLTGNLRVLPQLSTDHRKITGYSDLRVPNVDIGVTEKYKCGGSVDITVGYNDGKKTTVQHYNRPLKYTKDPTKKYNEGRGYCAATLPAINTSGKTGTWSFDGSLSNNQYFANATAAQATVTIDTNGA